MRYLEFSPSFQLEHLVKKFWILEYRPDTKDALEYSLFADGLPNLVIQYSGDRFLVDKGKGFQKTPLSHFSGPSDKPANMKSSGPFGMIGACLYPRATQSVFNLRSEEITTLDIELHSLFGVEAALLEERITRAKRDLDRIEVLSRFLIKKDALGKGWSVIDRVVQAVVSNRGLTSISDLARYSGYSMRQFERGFKQATGLPPKYFSRITRFQAAMHAYEKGFEGNLGALAYESGYADQAHFIREFAAFSGMSPKVYFKELDEVASSFVRL